MYDNMTMYKKLFYIRQSFVNAQAVRTYFVQLLSKNFILEKIVDHLCEYLDYVKSVE